MIARILAALGALAAVVAWLAGSVQGLRLAALAVAVVFVVAWQWEALGPKR